MGGENAIRPGQATSRCSWIRPNTASLLRRGGTACWRWCFGRDRGLLTQRPMRPVPVALGGVVAEDAFEVPTAEDHHPVEALAAPKAPWPRFRPRDRYAKVLFRVSG